MVVRINITFKDIDTASENTIWFATQSKAFSNFSFDFLIFCHKPCEVFLAIDDIEFKKKKTIAFWLAGAPIKRV